MLDIFIIIMNCPLVPSLQRNGLFPCVSLPFYPFPKQAMEKDLVIQSVFDKHIIQNLNKNIENIQHLKQMDFNAKNLSHR